jgi:hypothetical protein
MSGRTAKELLEHALPTPVIDIAAAKAPPQHKGMVESKDFARTWLEQLVDPAWDSLHGARNRTWLYLVAHSREGQCPVRFTNEMAAEIRLTRGNKARVLAWLESVKLIRIVSRNNQVVIVEVMKPPYRLGPASN